MTATRNRPISTDARGRYKVDVGRKLNDSGNYVPHRFLLGADKAVAERSAARLKQLWDAIETQHGERIERATTRYREIMGNPTAAPDRQPATWDSFTLRIADQVAKGANVITVPDYVAADRSPDLDYAAWFNRICNDFPFLLFAPLERHTSKLADGLSENRSIVEKEVEAVVAKAKTFGRLGPKGGRSRFSLHDALNAYAESIKREGIRDEDGDLKGSQLARLERVKRFKLAHEDIPLDDLNRDVVAGIVAHWRNRPLTRKGTRSSRHNVRHHLTEWFAFMRWLDGAERFGWAMPRGVLSLPRKVVTFDHERKVSSVSKNVFSVEQLATLNRHATPLERMMLYVGLNCAHGAAEAGRVRLDDLALKQPHPYADKLHFSTHKEDNFLRFLRPKTDVFGEWRLWQPVADMVEWGVARAKAKGSDLLFCYNNGLRIYGRARNAQQGFRNLWDALLDRVQETDPTFPRFPYGSLRDTLPDTIRHKYDGELSSVCLCHGSPAPSDDLLECYANKPFGRLHKATAELFDFYKPVFDAIDDPTDKRRKFYSPAVVEKMKNDRAAGVPVAKIARELGVSEMTVRRHTSAPVG